MSTGSAVTSEGADTRLVFRQPQALTLGIAVMVLCVLLVLLGLRSSVGLSARDVAWPLAAALAAWALFVRPRVVLSEDAVVLDNLVRAVQIPWERIEATQARWNLRVVTTGGAAFGAWAISKQRPPRSSVRSMSGFGGGEMGLRTAFRNARDAQIDTDAYRNPGDRPKSAGAVASLIYDEQDRRAAAGSHPVSTREVRVVPAWQGIVALAAALILVVVAVLA